MRRSPWLILLAVVALGASSFAVAPPAVAQAAGPIPFTILHTNDFHGQLEPNGSNPGMARTADVIGDVHAAVGAENVLLLDVGDEMQGSLLSNIQQGEPTIAVYNAMGYDAATFGNHEFDWGQDTLVERTDQAIYPYVSANIVAGDCAGWTPPSFATPYTVLTVGTAPDEVKVAVIGVTSTETPTITIAEATEGLCFKDPAASILHYYDEMQAAADVVVVLSHLGFNDGGYGYGIPVYGDKTLAQKLIDAGKPVPLILGGHSHTDLSAATIVGPTTVAQAHYNGRKVGRADLTFDPATGAVSVAWQRLTVQTAGDMDPAIDALIQTYATDPDYLALINQPVGYAQTDLFRNYNGDSMMGDFVDDAILGALNGDADPTNDVDLFLNNAGGIRTDWCDAPDPANPGEYIWSSNVADCAEGLWAHDPMLLTYGQMFTILPFGNQTVVGTMTGAQILEVLNQAATLGKGAIQPAGMEYSFYRYSDALPGPQPWAWGAFDACVDDPATGECEPLDLERTYRVGTNEFLAPAGGDNYSAFKYMTDITYWGDMLDAVNAYVSANHTAASPYRGPDGDGTLDGRIARDGTDAGGSIVPITVLHHNDSHGNLAKGAYVGYTQLATLIAQERAHNPGRTLLLNGGDSIQGDAMSYYFKTAPTGFASDGTSLPEALHIQPLIAAFNAMSYDAMVLGNHEFNFGAEVFASVLAQAEFPILGANVADDGSYGLADVNGGAGVQPYIEKTLDGIDVGIIGITNHRVPNYELPSNIPGLTFSDPIAAARDQAAALADDDVVIALTHIGFTTDPKSVEVDENVDTNLAAQVAGIDAIVGSHSHTNPATGAAPYKYLPAVVANPDGEPVLINQAYRYNNTLGEIVIGVREQADGSYDVVTRAGQYITVAAATAEHAATKAIVDPYVALLAAYNATEIGQTTAPIDALTAYVEETTGANLQADAAVWELEANGITDVDIHLSGAMSNRKVAATATEATPVTLKVADMFTLMPYENSLVVMEMNGPQLKAVLERAYRNYYYYTYVPGFGGYSYYTTCMLDTNSVGRILYRDTYPDMPSGDNVAALDIGGTPVDFSDADTYYKVSTVNYLAAGSCNFNDGGVSLWPLDQIVHDTQYYVRDAVIDYVTAMGTVSPAVEGRLVFGDAIAPVVTVTSPTAGSYAQPGTLTLDFAATDEGSGVMTLTATLDGAPVADGDAFDLYGLAAGAHSLVVSAVDWYGNSDVETVAFTVTVTATDLDDVVRYLYDEGLITKAGVRDALLAKLAQAESALAAGKTKVAEKTLEAFIGQVNAQTGKSIDAAAAALLIADAKAVIASL